MTLKSASDGALDFDVAPHAGIDVRADFRADVRPHIAQSNTTRHYAAAAVSCCP
jgi:hypothetical protein